MDKFEKLEKIQKLKEDGVITEEEFEKEKQGILNGNEKQRGSKGLYITSMVLGICSATLGLIPFLGFILAMAALILNIIAKKQLKRNNEKNGFVKTGMILSIVGMVCAFIMTIMPLSILMANKRRAINVRPNSSYYSTYRYTY